MTCLGKPLDGILASPEPPPAGRNSSVFVERGNNWGFRKTGAFGSIYRFLPLG